MERGSFTDETLMAYADGELDPATAAEVSAALQADALLAERVRVFTATREVLVAAGQSRLEPAPARAVALAMAAIDAARGNDAATGAVIPFRGRAGLGARMLPTALAASLALAVGLGAGLMLRSSEGARAGFATVEPDVQRALSTVPSGERMALAQGRFSAIASFRTADGALCREFEIDGPDRTTVVSVACRGGDAWEPRFAVIAGTSDPNGYAPASSLDALETYLGAIGANPPLSIEEEAQTLKGSGVP